VILSKDFHGEKSPRCVEEIAMTLDVLSFCKYPESMDFRG
ncbi:unnamed protein product, partial [Acidithrix sp. C25]